MTDDAAKLDGGKINLHDLADTYNMETSANCLFGITVSETFKQPEGGENLLVSHSKRLGQYSPYDGIMTFLSLTPFKHLIDALKIPGVDNEGTKILDKLVRDTMVMRSCGGTGPDPNMIDLMVEALNDHKSEFTAFEKPDLIATAAICLISGHDAPSIVLSICLWILAKHRDVQARLKDEIKAAFNASDDNQRLTYPTVQGMEYLDMVLNETLRRYPVSGLIVTRECVKDYKLPGTEVTVRRGQIVHIPAWPIHMDEAYWPDPERFDPERFSPLEKARRHNMAFLAFGQGPRKCIGFRFALLQIKTAVVHCLSHFDLKPCAETSDEIEMDPVSKVIWPKRPLIVKFEPSNFMRSEAKKRLSFAGRSDSFQFPSIPHDLIK